MYALLRRFSAPSGKRCRRSARCVGMQYFRENDIKVTGANQDLFQKNGIIIVNFFRITRAPPHGGQSAMTPTMPKRRSSRPSQCRKSRKAIDKHAQKGYDYHGFLRMPHYIMYSYRRFTFVFHTHTLSTPRRISGNARAARGSEQ